MGSLDDRRLLGDCTAAADLLGVEPVAVLGFCMGGMVSLKAAATGRFDRAVSFYGMIRLPEAWRSPTMAEPLDVLGGAPDRAPILHLCGTRDPYVPVADLDTLEERGGATVVRYQGADHGFVHDAEPPRPPSRRRGRRLAPGGRLPGRLTTPAPQDRRSVARVSEPGGSAPRGW